MENSVNWLKNAKRARRILNLWPPLIGAGIRIISWSDDYRFARARLKLRWWNKNAHGTQFGGSIFAMTDLMFTSMLMGSLGNQYYVWDKHADINFIKPGRGSLFVDFVISEDKLAAIIEATKEGEKAFPEFIVNVLDAEGEVVARVRRVLYVRKKKQYRVVPDIS